MKAYVVTTGSAFGLLVVAHVWRMIEEGPRLARDPVFVAFTVAAAVFCVWAVLTARRIPRQR
jgi:tellurite resistance protein TehA-like permease